MSEFKDAFEKQTSDFLEGQRKTQPPLYRDDLINSIFKTLKANTSVLLCGDSGVGKTSVLRGVARKLQDAAQQLREINTGSILVGARFLGDWQEKMQQIMAASNKAGAVLYFVDIWNINSVGASTNDPSAIFDFIREDLRKGRLTIVGEVLPDTLQELHKVPGFVELFEVVEVPPLTTPQIAGVLAERVGHMRLPLGDGEIKHILRLTDSFKARQKGPGAAIELLEQIKTYRQEKKSIREVEPLNKDFIDKVFSVYSGLPLFIISASHTKPVTEIRHWFRERIIGQQQAIEAVIESIALFKSGIRDPRQPIGTFLFVGPTGVGKTEMAKTLARFLFGSEQRLLRFDMSEYKDHNSYMQLLGSPHAPGEPARLLDPVKVQPFQVILFDEIEKAHPNTWDLLLQLLDEGRLSSPTGTTVSFRSTIIICTSNAGAEQVQRSPIGFNPSQQQAAPTTSSPVISLAALEQCFRPEILNRFQHIVTFQPLNELHMSEIARAEIGRIFQRDGISNRNLAVDIDDNIIGAVVDAGFDSRYGARALKRSVQRIVALPIAYYLMEHQVTPGSLLMLSHTNGRTIVRAAKTEASRQQQATEREQQAIARSVSNRQQLIDQQQSLQTEFDEIEKKLDRWALEQRLASFDASKESEDFWQHSQQAFDAILEAERDAGVLQRLDHLRYRLEELATSLDGPQNLHRLPDLAQRQQRLARSLERCRRELLQLGRQGDQDALLLLTPVGQPNLARDYYYQLLIGWISSMGRNYQLISEPQSAADSTMLLIQGPFALGYLREEAGLHRLRHDETSSTIRVGVAPYSGDELQVQFFEQIALKRMGCYGGRIRSLLQFAGVVTDKSKQQEGLVKTQRLVLKNKNSLNHNRELAKKIAHAMQSVYDSDDVVRRYDDKPFAVKDYKTGFTASRKEDFVADKFQTILEKRIDLI